MLDYGNIQTSALFEMLVKQTEEYDKMLGENDRSEAFYQFEKEFHLLLEEISSRNTSDIPISKSDPAFATDVH